MYRPTLGDNTIHANLHAWRATKPFLQLASDKNQVLSVRVALIIALDDVNAQ
jgi:hypothetical protein